MHSCREFTSVVLVTMSLTSPLLPIKSRKMASDGSSKKLRVVLIPFFATSHIGPFTDFAVRLAAARPTPSRPPSRSRRRTCLSFDRCSSGTDQPEWSRWR
uniref:Uncharacterized protein n=1 Tax=Oryza punctata TaxID=4537 RepID=A0A0E0L4B5_ORYPU